MKISEPLIQLHQLQLTCFELLVLARVGIIHHAVSLEWRQNETIYT